MSTKSREIEKVVSNYTRCGGDEKIRDTDTTIWMGTQDYKCIEAQNPKNPETLRRDLRSLRSRYNIMYNRIIRVYEKGSVISCKVSILITTIIIDTYYIVCIYILINFL